jgi:hypothetical protein
MSKNKTATWTRTIEAAKAEQGSAWSMILAYADEAYDRDSTYRDATSGLVIHELRGQLLDAGVELAHGTLQARAIVAIHVHQATPADRTTLTSVGWTVIREFANRSYSPEASAEAIRRCRAAGEVPTVKWANAEAGDPHVVAEPHVTTDGEAFKDAGRVFRQKLAADRGEWTPSTMTQLLWQLVSEVLAGQPVPTDLDDELKKLLAAESGH